MKKRFGFLTVIVVTVLTFMAGNVVAASAIAKAAEKTAAPSFSLQGIQGKTVGLADFKGQGVLLFFFTTWCPYCREKFPMLKEKDQASAAEGFKLIVIDAGESRDKVASFAEKMGVSFDILLDQDTTVSSEYGVVGVPTFFLINKEGQIVFQGNELPNNYKTLLSS
jgi:peroxiredoxin